MTYPRPRLAASSSPRSMAPRTDRGCGRSRPPATGRIGWRRGCGLPIEFGAKQRSQLLKRDRIGLQLGDQCPQQSAHQSSPSWTHARIAEHRGCTRLSRRTASAYRLRGRQMLAAYPIVVVRHYIGEIHPRRKPSPTTRRQCGGARGWQERAPRRVATGGRRGPGLGRPPPRGCASRDPGRGLSPHDRSAACASRKLAAEAPAWRMSCPCIPRTR
jgi:hypothetical protein